MQDIKLLWCDVDGTLTDGRVYVDDKGSETLCFSKIDGHGIKNLKEEGIKVAFITAESVPWPAKHRAKKLGVTYFISNAHNKLTDLQKLCEREHISLDEVAGIGDDINDFCSLNACGLKACPQDAQEKIKNIPHMIVLSKKGGYGAVREFIDDYILKNI